VISQPKCLPGYVTVRAKPIYMGAPAGPPVRKQNRLDLRDPLAGGGARGRVADGIDGIAGDVVASGEENAHYGPGVFCDLAVLAAVSDGPVHAFSRDSAEKRDHAGGSPTGEWSRLASRRAAGADPAPELTAAAAGQLRGLRRSGSLPKGPAFAIDKTPVRRWDKKPGDALVRDRTEKGKQASGAHKAAQAAERRAGITAAAVRVLPGHTLGGWLSIIGSRTAAACAAAGISPTPLMDRESCTAGCVAFLNELGKGWPVPCPNTPRVTGSLRDRAKGARPRVSTAWITDGHGREEAYTMIIEKRKRNREEGAPPGEGHIAFAASGPDIDAREYAKRWDTGTGYRMVGNARIKAPGRSEAVRTLCLVLSLAVHTSWAMVCAAARLATRGGVGYAGRVPARPGHGDGRLGA